MQITSKKGGQTTLDAALQEISNLLSQHQEIRFAYIYGSFLGDGAFNDIDIGIMLDAHYMPDLLYQEGLALEIEKRLRHSCNVTKPVDVRVLNTSKNVRFLHSMLANAKILLSRDDFERSRFECRVLGTYLDMKSFHERHDKLRMARYESR